MDFHQPTAPSPMIPKMGTKMNIAAGASGSAQATAPQPTAPSTDRSMFMVSPQTAPAMADPGAFKNKMSTGGSGMKGMNVGGSPNGMSSGRKLDI